MAPTIGAEEMTPVSDVDEVIVSAVQLTSLGEDQGLFFLSTDDASSLKSKGSMAFMKRTKSLAKSQRLESKTTLSSRVAN